MPSLVAQPWWVNLLLLVPLAGYFSWRRRRVPLSALHLISSAVFAAAFGFLEAVVVVYLRAAAGWLPGYRGSLSDVIRLSREGYLLPPSVADFPQSLLTLEVFREAATILPGRQVDLLHVLPLTVQKGAAPPRHQPEQVRVPPPIAIMAGPRGKAFAIARVQGGPACPPGDTGPDLSGTGDQK